MSKKGNFVSRIEKALDDFRLDVNKRFEATQEEIKRLAEVMLKQVQTEGNVTRLEDALKRIGKQVDGLDERTREIEQISSSQKTAIFDFNKLIWWVLGIFGAFITGLLLYIVRNI